MEKKTNYRRIFKKPVVLYSIGEFRLPFGLPLKKTLIGFVALAVAFLLKLLIFSHMMPFIFAIKPLHALYYIIIVLVSANFFANDYAWADSKTVYRFLIDYFKYLLEIKLPKKIFYKDKMANEIQEKVRIIIK